MFSRVAAIATLAFVAVAAAGDSKCNTGPVQCCNKLESVRIAYRSLYRLGLMVAWTGELRCWLCHPVPARDRRPGRNGEDRSRMLATLRRGRWKRQRVLCSACVLREQQRREYTLGTRIVRDEAGLITCDQPGWPHLHWLRPHHALDSVLRVMR